MADVTRGGGGESVDANNSGSRGTKVPSAEDLAGYNQRLEFLRRKRDDLVSAAAAAAAAADVELSEQQQQQQQRRADNYTDSRARRAGGGGGGSQSNSSDDRMEQRRQHQEATARSPSLSSHTSRNKNGNSKKYGDTRGGGGGDGLFGGRGRRHGEGAGAVGGRAADEAEADQVAQEISSMAGRLKESSMAINQTLRTQTQVRRSGHVGAFCGHMQRIRFLITTPIDASFVCCVPVWWESVELLRRKSIVDFSCCVTARTFPAVTEQGR